MERLVHFCVIRHHALLKRHASIHRFRGQAIAEREARLQEVRAGVAEIAALRDEVRSGARRA